MSLATADYIAHSKNLWLLFTGLNNPHKLIALSIYNWPLSTKFFYTLLWVLGASLHRIVASSVSRASNYVLNCFNKNFVFFSSIVVLSFQTLLSLQIAFNFVWFLPVSIILFTAIALLLHIPRGAFLAGRNRFGTCVICRFRPGGTNTVVGGGGGGGGANTAWQAHT